MLTVHKHDGGRTTWPTIAKHAPPSWSTLPTVDLLVAAFFALPEAGSDLLPDGISNRAHGSAA